MDQRTDSLPEGTDTIIPGAAVETTPSPDMSAGAQQPGTSQGAMSAAARTVEEKASGLRGQAADRAREYATQGKDRAASALDSVQKLVDDAAGTIDEKVGPQYGDYARRAAEAVSGLASTLRTKQVDELFDEARDVVRKSPALAIGAAAAIGFVLARLVKAGAPAAEESATTTSERNTSATTNDPAA